MLRLIPAQMSMSKLGKCKVYIPVYMCMKYNTLKKEQAKFMAVVW